MNRLSFAFFRSELVVLIAFASIAGLLPRTAAAFLSDPCFTAGTGGWVPYTPSTKDAIGIRVSLTSVQVLAKFQYVLSKVEQTSSNSFAVSVVLTNDTSPFSDYRRVGASDGSFAFIGPLAAGTYSIVGSVKTYDPNTRTTSPACDPNSFPTENTRSFVVYVENDPTYQALHAIAGPVIEYYNGARDHYFITMDADEIHDLDTGVHEGWSRTGQTFLAYVSQRAPGYDLRNLGDTTAVRRYYGLPSAGLDSHFLTVDVSEYIDSPNPLAKVWIQERLQALQIYQPLTATGECRANTIPVYRVWNNRVDSGHRYTTDPATVQAMVAQGWIAEGYGNGVVMCSPL